MSATIVSQQSGKPSKILNIAIWSSQVLLALIFGMAGLTKGTQPISELAKQMSWVTVVPEALVRFIAASEFAGALGLLLPSVTRIKPRLTPIAAMGLAVVMGLASAFHISRGELGMVPVTGIIGGLAAFVAWGRFKKAPIQPRG